MYIYIYLGPGRAGPVLQPGLPAAAAAAQPAAAPGRAGAAAGAAAAVAWQGASSVVNLVSSVAHGLCRQQVGGVWGGGGSQNKAGGLGGGSYPRAGGLGEPPRERGVAEPPRIKRWEILVAKS